MQKAMLAIVMLSVTAAAAGQPAPVPPAARASPPQVDPWEIVSETPAPSPHALPGLSLPDATGHAQENTAAAQAAERQEAYRRLADAVNIAVTNWENEVQSRDPDYVKKAPTVQRIAQALIAKEGLPATAEAAVALVKRAYEETNVIFAQAISSTVPPAQAPAAQHPGAEPDLFAFASPPPVSAPGTSRVPTTTDMFIDLVTSSAPIIFAGFAALAGQVVGTSLSPELWIAVVLVVIKSRSWKVFLGASILATMAVAFTRVVLLAAFGGAVVSFDGFLQMGGATLIAVLLWSALGVGLRRLATHLNLHGASGPAVTADTADPSRMQALSAFTDLEAWQATTAAFALLPKIHINAGSVRTEPVPLAALKGKIEVKTHFFGKNWRSIVAILLTAFGAAALADYLQEALVNVAVSLHDGLASRSVPTPVFVAVVALLTARAIWQSEPVAFVDPEPIRRASTGSPPRTEPNSPAVQFGPGN
jgi:hypothetical protein